MFENYIKEVIEENKENIKLRIKKELNNLTKEDLLKIIINSNL